MDQQQQQIQGELAVAILDFKVQQRINNFGRKLDKFARNAGLDERQVRNLVRASIVKAMKDF